MVNYKEITYKQADVIQFHSKSSFQVVKDNNFKCKLWQTFVYSFYHVHNYTLELSMHWAIWMVQISSTFLRISDKAYFLCIDSYIVHSYENNHWYCDNSADKSVCSMQQNKW